MHQYAEIHPDLEQVIDVRSFPNPVPPERIKVKDGRKLLRPIVRDKGEAPNELTIEMSRIMVVEPDRVVERSVMGLRPDAAQFIASEIERRCDAMRSAIIGSDPAAIESRRLRGTDAWNYLGAVRDGAPEIPAHGEYPMLDSMIPFEARTHREAAEICIREDRAYVFRVAAIEHKRYAARRAMAAGSSDDAAKTWELVKDILR